MLTRLDHLVILVRDLELASADYESLGFAVTPGGEHAGGLAARHLDGATGVSRLEISAPDARQAAASLYALADISNDKDTPVRLGACVLSPVARSG
ncbi:hypothetical protein BH18ACT11_BH18ACT11_23530 [soil metagenome]